MVDTVELFHFKRQRKLSLRFLAAYLLHERIQQGTHDSIVDARTALALFQVGGSSGCCCTCLPWLASASLCTARWQAPGVQQLQPCTHVCCIEQPRLLGERCQSSVRS